MKNVIGKNGLILAAFSLVTTGLIALVYILTIDQIESVKEQELLSTLNELVDNSSFDNQLHLDCITLAPEPLLGGLEQRVYRARLGNENKALILETTAPDGYSGAIKLLVAIDIYNTVLGARVVEHKETPGLGDKIELRISDWILGFAKVSLQDDTIDNWQVKKDGGQFDQFTGATITPRAVVNAIKNAGIYGQKNMDRLFEQRANCSNSQVSASFEQEHST